MDKVKSVLKWFLTDSKGNLVIWQLPNLPLIGWLAFTVSTHIITTGIWNRAFDATGFGLLFTWAWLEITKGESPV